MADVVEDRRYLIEIHPKTGEYAVRDMETEELLDIQDCARLLNASEAPG